MFVENKCSGCHFLHQLLQKSPDFFCTGCEGVGVGCWNGCCCLNEGDWYCCC